MPRKAQAGAVYARPQQEYTLASGRPVVFKNPDFYALASGGIELPNQTKLDIWEMVYRGLPDVPKEQLLSDERYTRTLFHCAQLVTEPRVRLDDDDEEGVVERWEWILPDLLAAYSFLRWGPPKVAKDKKPGASEEVAPASGGLPPSAE